MRLTDFDPAITVLDRGVKRAKVKAGKRELFVQEHSPSQEHRYFDKFHKEVVGPTDASVTETTEQTSWDVWDAKLKPLGRVTLERTWVSDNRVKEVWTWTSPYGVVIEGAAPWAHDSFRQAAWKMQQRRRGCEEREYTQRAEVMPRTRSGRGEDKRDTIKVPKRRR